MILIFLALLLTPFIVNGQEYIWPTDSGQYLSSTFGETRSAHFHAALDIKTWGQEGYRVFASKSGYVDRLVITERGYGYAVYLKHPDGTTTVYAHLQRFNNKLQVIADSVRMNDHSYELNLSLRHMNIEVEQGEVIAYTGSTGIGPPHLHFEIRDKENRPLNPLIAGFKIKDTLPPVFSTLIVEPLDLNSRVNGKPISETFRPKKVNSTHYDYGDIEINGNVGIAVNVFDKADEVFNSYATYTLSLISESGDTLFHHQLDHINFDQSNLMFLDRIAPFRSNRRGHQRLYKKRGLELPFFKVRKKESVISLSESDSSRSYTLAASDYFGNTSTARINFIGSDPIFQTSKPYIITEPRNWYWHENWVSTDLTSTLDLTASDLGFPWQEGQQVILSHDSTKITLGRLIPEKRSIIKTPDQALKVVSHSNTVHDTMSIAISHKVVENKLMISIEPSMLPLKSHMNLEFYSEEYVSGSVKNHLYRVNPTNGRTSFMGSKIIGNTIHANINELGTFTILSDTAKPSITNFRIKKNNYGMWIAAVYVKDELSGIRPSSAIFTINGVRGIPEYHFKTEELIYYLPGFSPDKYNEAYIYIEDRAGNSKEAFFESANPVN